MLLTIPTLLYLLQQFSIYLSIPVLIAGLIGNVLCVIVFTSLRTFRDNPCSFYLTCGTFINIGQLLTGFLTRIMITGFTIDWTQKSLFYCKFRPWLLESCTLISLTCICLATIDQFLATSTRPSWQQLSNLKLAHRLVLITSIIWFIHGIPFAITSDIQNGYCSIYNAIFAKYFTQVYYPILLGVLPLLIMNTFSFLSLRNIKQINRRQVPLIRRELDQQLTKMVLVQVIFVTITTIPFISQYTYVMNTTFTDILVSINQQFLSAVLNIFWYVNYSAPFYIFYCSSARFRKQFYYVCIHHQRIRCHRFANRINTLEAGVTAPVATIENVVVHYNSPNSEDNSFSFQDNKPAAS